MDGIVVKLVWYAKRRLQRDLKKTKDAKFRVRCNIVLLAANGGGPTHIARVLMVSRTTVYNVVRAYRRAGVAGLADGSVTGRLNGATRRRFKQGHMGGRAG